VLCRTGREGATSLPSGFSLFVLDECSLYSFADAISVCLKKPKRRLRLSHLWRVSVISKFVRTREVVRDDGSVRLGLCEGPNMGTTVFDRVKKIIKILLTIIFMFCRFLFYLSIASG